jgi:hypothetical protein
VIAGDVLVHGLAAAEGNPETVRKHLGQRRRRLGDDGGVIANTRRVDDPEGEGGRLQRGPEPGPGKPRLALRLAPRRPVVGAHGRSEPGLLGGANTGQQFTGAELLV